MRVVITRVTHGNGKWILNAPVFTFKHYVQRILTYFINFQITLSRVRNYIYIYIPRLKQCDKYLKRIAIETLGKEYEERALGDSGFVISLYTEITR